MPQLPEPYRLFFEVQYVGRLIKQAKRRVCWKFAFDGDADEHSVVLMHTLNSGKKVVFLNGNQIFEEENLSAGKFIYPFQLDRHLITVEIEAQVETEGMYELIIDGTPFEHLHMRTLQDIRSNANSRSSRGGETNAGRSGGGGRSRDHEVAEQDDPVVPSMNMNDFMGGSSSSASKNQSNNSGGGGGGGSWDPFGGQSGGSDAFGGPDAFGGAPEPAPAPAPALPPKRHAANAISTTAATSTSSALRAPTQSAPAPKAVSSDPFDPFGDAPAPASHSSSGSGSKTATSSSQFGGGVSSLSNDLAGLSFGSSVAPSQPQSRSTAAAIDPFASDFGNSNRSGGFGNGGAPSMPIHSAPQPAPHASPLDDLFGSGPSLVNLDNLSAPPKTEKVATKPTLGQMNTGGMGGGFGMQQQQQQQPFGGMQMGGMGGMGFPQQQQQQQQQKAPTQTNSLDFNPFA